ncbi:hypothetical protein INR49_003715 [Caranx melampygus]|nr:hypothetical protein INR49_003715 [Caranx melampygus]
MWMTPRITDIFILKELRKVSLLVATFQICKDHTPVPDAVGINMFWKPDVNLLVLLKRKLDGVQVGDGTPHLSDQTLLRDVDVAEVEVGSSRGSSISAFLKKTLPRHTLHSILSKIDHVPGKGTSGFSPVSTVGMLAFLISFSTNPVQQKKSRCVHIPGKCHTAPSSGPDWPLTWSHYLLSFLSISSHLLTSFTNLR